MCQFNEQLTKLAGYVVHYIRPFCKSVSLKTYLYHAYQKYDFLSKLWRIYIKHWSDYVLKSSEFNCDINEVNHKISFEWELGHIQTK